MQLAFHFSKFLYSEELGEGVRLLIYQECQYNGNYKGYGSLFCSHHAHISVAWEKKSRPVLASSNLCSYAKTSKHF